VVPGCDEGIGQTFKKIPFVVENLIGLSVHESLGTDDICPKGVANRLVPQADSEQRDSPRKVANTLDRNPCLPWCARAGRNDDPLRSHSLNLVDRDLIVATNNDFQRIINLPEPLNKVVSKRIVIIENKDHLAKPFLPSCHTLFLLSVTVGRLIGYSRRMLSHVLESASGLGLSQFLPPYVAIIPLQEKKTQRVDYD